jgi:hypothetical protein
MNLIMIVHSVSDWLMAESDGGQSVVARVKSVLCGLKIGQEKRKCWTVSMGAPRHVYGIYEQLYLEFVLYEYFLIRTPEYRAGNLPDRPE